MADRDGLVDDFGTGLATLDRIGIEAGVDTLVLRAPATLTWLTGGRVNVPNTLESACFDVVVTGLGGSPTATVVTNAIEAPRLQATELLDLPVRYQVVPWAVDRAGELPTGATVGTDSPGAGRIDLQAAVAAARRVLTDLQAERLRQICGESAAVATAVATRLEPAMTEYAAAGLLAAALLERELEPVCLFVAGGDRMGRHRHPLPTGEILGTRASFAFCARRNGLIASVTRIVSFGPAPYADRYRAILAVEQDFLDATKPGATLGDVVRFGTASYAENGFDPQEWRRHHQGGLSGWQPREFPATADSALALAENNVVAWNPSGDTVKVEDTCVVTSAGVQTLVHDADWPTLTVGGRIRPDLLIR